MERKIFIEFIQTINELKFERIISSDILGTIKYQDEIVKVAQVACHYFKVFIDLDNCPLGIDTINELNKSSINGKISIEEKKVQISVTFELFDEISIFKLILYDALQELIRIQERVKKETNFENDSL